MNRLAARKFLRALLWVVSAMVVLVLAGVLSSPYWLGAALKSIGEGQGLTFSRYERQGFGSFVLHGVRYEADAMSAEVDTIDLPSIPGLFWGKLTGQPAQISISEATVESIPVVSEPSEVSGEEASPAALLAEGYHYLGLVDAWPVHLSIDKVSYRDGDLTAIILNTHYADGQFSTNLETSLSPQKVAVTGQRSKGESLEISATVSPEPVQVSISTRLISDKVLELEGQLEWRKQPASFDATWEGPGWLPDTAHVNIQDWTLPEELLATEDRQGYAAPVASVQLLWEQAQYSIALQGKAVPEPLGDSADMPPLTAMVKATGGLESVDLKQIEIEGGWVRAQLAESVTVPFTDLRDLPPARFDLSADFSQQSLLPMTGTLKASVIADDRPGNTYPLISASIEAADIAYVDYQVPRVSVSAELDWPLLTLNQSAIDLGQDSTLKAAGKYDLEAETFQSFTGALSLSGKLAQGYGLTEPAFGSVDATFEVNGPRAKTRHFGNITVKQLSWAEDVIDLDLAWKGEHGHLEVLSGKGGGETLDLAWEGSADLSLDEQSIRLHEARLSPHGLNELALTQPVTLTHRSGGEVLLEGLAIQGSEGGSVKADATIQWPNSGQIAVTAQDISPVWLKLLTDAKIPFPIKLDSLQAEAQWNRGPMEFSLNAEAIGEPVGQAPISLSLNSTGNGEGIALNSLNLRQGTTILAEAQGQVPVAVDPSAEKLLQIQAEAPANFQMKAKPGATPLWKWLQKEYTLTLENPQLDLQLSGSLARPDGSLNVSLASLSFPEGSGLPHIPKTEDIRVDARFSPDKMLLETFRLDIAQNPLEVNGELPMTQDAWMNLLTEGQVPDLEKARGKMHFESVPIAAFADYLPEFIRPNGELSLNATLEPGLDWIGRFSMTGAETRPLPNLGSLSNISANMTMSGQTLTIERASALVGGRELAISGQVGLADWLAPSFDLKVEGQSVPFVRAPGMIIRGSPQLTLKTDENAVTTLGGIVKLEESFYTVDLVSLGQSNSSDPNRRFPYFSVDEEPLSKWRLDIDVEGDGFLRVRTPVFEGILSADLELGGTLYEPLAIGQVAIDRGVVQFPFANFRVDQGTVTIRQDQPYSPIIDVTANGRAYGYDITLRITGTPDDPQIAFTSTPSLEQGDILLMVTAGRMPVNDQRSSQSRLAGLGVFIGNTILVDLGLIDPLDDQLQIFIGEDITETGKDTIRVIYRINATWAIVGQYDRFDAYTLDFKWTVYSD